MMDLLLEVNSVVVSLSIPRRCLDHRAIQSNWFWREHAAAYVVVVVAAIIIIEIIYSLMKKY